MDKEEKQKINIAELLKDAPIGTKLYSSIFGECELYKVDMNSITAYSIIKVAYYIGGIKDTRAFTAYGKYYDIEGAECLLFPAKGKTWENFEAPWKHKHFEPFQKVLVRSCGLDTTHEWRCSFYSHFKNGCHYAINGHSYTDLDIITYEGNEELLGKEVEK